MEIAGLPLHPLVVHAAVVLTPLAALMGLGYALVPRWRAWLRWPMLAVTLASAAAVVTAYFSGRSLRHLLLGRGVQDKWIAIHAHRAGILLWLTLALTVVVLATAVPLHRRVVGASDVTTRTSVVVLALLAVATLVSVVLTGDAGARAVWGG